MRIFRCNLLIVTVTSYVRLYIYFFLVICKLIIVKYIAQFGCFLMRGVALLLSMKSEKKGGRCLFRVKVFYSEHFTFKNQRKEKPKSLVII